MFSSKIRYRLVYNYSGRLNRQGQAAVVLECRQEERKIYISSKVYLYPYQWYKGIVVNHPNQEKLTAYLTRWKNSIEETELDFLLKGKPMTLLQLKDAIKHNIRSNATLREFVESVVCTSSDRCRNTKMAYLYLANDIEKGIIAARP